MNIGRACGIFINIESDNFTEDEKLVAIRDVLKEMVTYNGITKDNILKAFRWFFDWAVEETVEETVDIPDLIRLIEEQPKGGEWIPCSERLPEDTKTKIITLSDGSVEGGYYSEENWWCVGDSINLEVVKTENVIAWMLLPPAYKEVSKDEL